MKNSLDGSSAVGPAFNGTYTISEKLDLKLIPENAAPLPVSIMHDSYLTLSCVCFTIHNND